MGQDLLSAGRSHSELRQIGSSVAELRKAGKVCRAFNCRFLGVCVCVVRLVRCICSISKPPAQLCQTSSKCTSPLATQAAHKLLASCLALGRLERQRDQRSRLRFSRHDGGRILPRGGVPRGASSTSGDWTCCRYSYVPLWCIRAVPSQC